MFHDEEDINQSINGLTLLSPPQEMDNVASSSNTRGPLGLTLSKTESFERLLETSLLSQAQHEVNQARPLVEKLKASNFPIDSLQIGKWFIVSTHDGHLTAKLYYSKKKIVWEVLEGPLKRKMEIQWSDITAINAVMPENQPGTLRFELAKPPLFFKETDPQPRKHTVWQPADDFTGGNATIWRTHCVSCPAGVINRHYENLLQCHKELVNLSRKPFPSHDIPFFSSAMHFGISRLHFNPNGFQTQAHYTYPGPRPISSNQTATANLHYMNTRSRNHQSSMFSNSEVVCFDEIEDDHMQLISEYLNLNNNNNPYNNNHSLQMMDSYQTTDYAPMGGDYVSSVPQPLDCSPHNGIIAVETTEMDNFINPAFVSPDNLTANANLLPDQHLLPDNYHTPYGPPFQNIHQGLLPDNDLAAPVNHHHLCQNQHAFPDNLRARVNDQYHLNHNQHAFPDNPTAPVNRHLHHNQHAFPDNATAPVNRHLHHNQHASPDNPTAPVNRHLYRNRNVFPDNPNRGNPYRK